MASKTSRGLPMGHNDQAERGGNTDMDILHSAFRDRSCGRSPCLRASARDQRVPDTIEEVLSAGVQDPGSGPDIDPAEFWQLRVAFDVPVPLARFGPVVLAREVDAYPVLRPADIDTANTRPRSSYTGICV
jgi:hypothetical protein